MPGSPQLSSASPGALLPQPERTVDLSRSASKRGREDIAGDWRGTTPQQPQVEGPCGACGEHIIARQTFTFAGWLAHTECVVENVQGASDRGDDRFRVAIREGNGLPHRRTFRLTQVPRVHQRYDGATEWSVYRRGQLAVSDFGGGGCHAPRSKRSTSRKKGWGGGRSIVHVLRSGSGTLDRGVGGQSHAGIRPVLPQKIGARPQHVGASGFASHEII